MRIAFLLLAAITLTSSASVAGEASHKGKGLTVTLVADVTAVQSGKSFYAGLLIRHERGYHTYWKNPGLAGVATRLEWLLPEGWKAGEIEWPEPEKVKMASINTHGYEKDTILQVKITPPAKLDKTVTLKTKASWMCCAKSCHPGFTDLELGLPVAENAPASKLATRMSSERTQYPVKVSGWKFTAVLEDQMIILSGQPDGDAVKVPEAPQFFPADNMICSHPEQPWTTDGRGFTAKLTASEFPPKDQSVLRGLLVGKGGWNAGDKRAVEIEVPVTRK